ncbi:small GTP-binding protein, putative [Trichomonas vaginalis G3]|uniref:small monomeric GTPase n=1 Tax=Trichomonas vaginalis (strain ATCC PRA-98 / G3) TaxID=412133 RepID=A2FX13_TRIV3|nr:GTPase protein [Trichomonas vaginalis G3]EAX90561.1 small GTP-binding protein, putative [Trichomonas vaginalis G3]KAI5542904.1 GTPase protein [Trichomonas vaginalis G3]|eukprot:XP_001303491.1 small GTP-binding protein [Trichomonas vaginalis G3]
MAEYKIVVFGAGAVGKSALTIQFVQGQFITDYDPTIEDSYKRPLNIDGESVQLDITDTAGQDDFAAMRTSYMRQGKGFILVYAIDDRASFEEMEAFHRELIRTKCTSTVPCVICGNKCDLEERRLVSKAEGEELAAKLKCRFFETSALTNYNIHETFTALVKDIIAESKPKPTDDNKQDKPEEGGNCCYLI